MFAIRSMTRSLPRAICKTAKPIVPRTTAPWIPRNQPVFKAFSTSIRRREPAGESDPVLSAKLAHEHKLELENQQNEELKVSIDDYFSNSPFKVEDKEGTHNVVLSRQFGNENIRIEFSVADMNDMDEEFDPIEEDTAFGDEDMTPDTTSGGKRTINQSGVKGGKIDVAAEDSIAPSDREDGFDEQSFDAQYPLHLSITITKPGKGATVIQAEAQNGAIDISQLSYYSRAELVDPKTPEEVQDSDNVYVGPPFTSLDTDLQTMILQYLEERGINAELAEVLPQYVDYKEQREYVTMLDNLKNFVDA